MCGRVQARWLPDPSPTPHVVALVSPCPQEWAPCHEGPMLRAWGWTGV